MQFTSDPYDKTRSTRYPELGYLDCGGHWRLVDQTTRATVGPHYKRKSELLMDLDRYAKDFGC